jgi:acetolactate synthase small subunit
MKIFALLRLTVVSSVVRLIRSVIDVVDVLDITEGDHLRSALIGVGVAVVSRGSVLAFLYALIYVSARLYIALAAAS